MFFDRELLWERTKIALCVLLVVYLIWGGFVGAYRWRTRVSLEWSLLDYKLVSIGVYALAWPFVLTEKDSLGAIIGIVGTYSEPLPTGHVQQGCMPDELDTRNGCVSHDTIDNMLVSIKSDLDAGRFPTCVASADMLLSMRTDFARLGPEGELMVQGVAGMRGLCNVQLLAHAPAAWVSSEAVVLTLSDLTAGIDAMQRASAEPNDLEYAYLVWASSCARLLGQTALVTRLETRLGEPGIRAVCDRIADYHAGQPPPTGTQYRAEFCATPSSLTVRLAEQLRQKMAPGQAE